MRFLTISLLLMFCVVAASAADSDFQKARIRRVHVGYVVPPPLDSGEMNSDKDADKDEHESRKSETNEHSAFIFLQLDLKSAVMQVDCAEHCVELQKKLLATPDVEVRFEGKKMLLKTEDQTLTGRLFTPKPNPGTKK